MGNPVDSEMTTQGKHRSNCLPADGSKNTFIHSTRDFSGITLMPRIYRLLAIIYALVVIVLSSWPGIKLPDIGTSHLDKILHFLQYAILAFLVASGWGRLPVRNALWRTGLLLGILVLFAGMDEYHQSWIPGRDPDWMDFLADGLGLAVGIGFWLGTGTRAGNSVSRA
jgi:VanZ family protein